MIFLVCLLLTLAHYIKAGVVFLVHWWLKNAVCCVLCEVVTEKWGSVCGKELSMSEAQKGWKRCSEEEQNGNRKRQTENR